MGAALGHRTNSSRERVLGVHQTGAIPQCAWAAARKKQSYLQAQFERLRHRRGPKKVVYAVAASILTAAHHMLKDGTVYIDLGHDHFRKRAPEQRAKALVR